MTEDELAVFRRQQVVHDNRDPRPVAPKVEAEDPRILVLVIPLLIFVVNNHLRGEKGLINAGYIQNTDTHTQTHRHTHVYTVIPLLLFVVNNHLRGEKGLINAGYIQNTDTHTYTHTHTHTDTQTHTHTSIQSSHS